VRIFGDIDVLFEGLVEDWAVRSTGGFFVGLNTCFLGPTGTGGLGSLAEGSGLVVMKAGLDMLLFLEAMLPLTGLVRLDLALSLDRSCPNLVYRVAL